MRIRDRSIGKGIDPKLDLRAVAEYRDRQGVVNPKTSGGDRCETVFREIHQTAANTRISCRKNTPHRRSEHQTAAREARGNRLDRIFPQVKRGRLSQLQASLHPDIKPTRFGMATRRYSLHQDWSLWSEYWLPSGQILLFPLRPKLWSVSEGSCEPGWRTDLMGRVPHGRLY